MSKAKESKQTTGGEISRRELLKMASPLGRVELDISRCTGCGLCSVDCPTEALTLSADADKGTYQLLFRHGICIACNKCLEVCPEQCLSLERVVEIDRIGSPAAVLFEDEIVRCRECGSPVGPRSMINSIKARMPAAGEPLPQLELCPGCRVKAMLSQV